MKVLLLNPHIDSEHGLVKGLQAKGLAVLLPGNPQEAWQMLSLHGSSLDLAIIHREESVSQDDEGGFAFLSKLKGDPQQADLPVIVTSHRWSDTEFARHQDSPQGVNAYLRWPFQAVDLYSLIEAVFGGSAPGTLALDVGSKPSIPTALHVPDSGGLVLQDASSLFANNSKPEKTDPGIQLEAPEFASDPAPGGIEISGAAEAYDPPVALTGSVELSSLNITTVRDPSDALAQVLAQDAGSGPELEVPSDLPMMEEQPDQGQPEAADPDVAQEMPYLFNKAQQQPPSFDPAMAFAQPLGDAVVPGGAAHTPDVDTLKKYLLLREQDVAVLSTQLKSAKDQVKSLEDALREERGRNTELNHVAQEQKRKIDDFDKERQAAVDSLQGEINELKFQLKARVDKARLLESQVREAADEMERLKERVRTDIRKIRVREKELENRLEIMKKDSEALLSARENKIIELKRKLDLLEFNMDLLQDQHTREKENASKLRDRLAKAAQVVRVAGGLLDNPSSASQLAAVLSGDDPKSEGVA